jgi:integrase/recombinase XerD
MMLEVKLFLQDLKADGAADKTLFEYEKNLNKFFDRMGIKNFTQIETLKKKDIQEYRIMLDEDGLTDSTINTYTAPVLKFIHFLYGEGYIDHDIHVSSRKTQPKPMTYLTESEAKLLIKNCRTKRQKAIFYLMINTGMRISEVTDLKLEDVDFEKSRINIRKAKRNELRYIPINWVCKRYINDYIGRKEIVKQNGEVVLDRFGYPVYRDGERIVPTERMSGNNNYLFTSTSGGKVDGRNVSKELKRVCERAGITKDITPHKLRSTAATLQSVHGTNVKNIQTMLGHQSVEMTMRYVQMVDKNYQDEITSSILWCEGDEEELADE